jgi:hypothetical protein
MESKNVARPPFAPVDTSTGFVGDLLEYAVANDSMFCVEGDVLHIDNLAVYHGTILSIIADGTSESSSHEITARCRVRIRGSHEVERPQAHVLVKGLNATKRARDAVQRASQRYDRGYSDSEPEQDEHEWSAVPASIESRAVNGDTVHVFTLYIGEPPEVEEAGSVVTAWVEDYEVDVTTSKGLSELWERYQAIHAVNAIEGVLVSDGACELELTEKLMAGIDGVIAAQSVPDYHPNSKDIVLDIVHPSLFPFVRGVSRVVGEEAELARAYPSGVETKTSDLWGRPYEDSKFQWLPSIFAVAEDGSVSIKTYINNLDRTVHGELYKSLALLFSKFVPMFEKVLAYVRAIKFHRSNEDESDGDISDIPRKYEPDFAASSLRGRQLKVITKIVQYGLQRGDVYDGAWHVEGMSHEQIVMTGLYILDRDENVGGGELLFKRAFLDYEASAIFMEVPQCRPQAVEGLISDGLRPIGTVHTPKGRMIVFPNSHVHKLNKMASLSHELATRRIIVFWVVNPDCEDMVTTAGVPAQQGTMAREDALRYRLELMEERRLRKQDWNVREIELCEH